MDIFLSRFLLYFLIALVFIEFITMILYIVIIAITVKTKPQVSKEDYKPYFASYIMAIIQIVFCSIFIGINIFSGILAIIMQDRSRLRWLSISFLIIFALIWLIFTIGLSFHFWVTDPEPIHDSFAVISLLNVICNSIAIIKSLVYMVAVSFSFIVGQRGERSLSRTFETGIIDDSLSHELYHSFLNAAKNPYNNKIVEKLGELVKKRSHSFEGRKSKIDEDDEEEEIDIGTGNEEKLGNPLLNNSAG